MNLYKNFFISVALLALAKPAVSQEIPKPDLPTEDPFRSMYNANEGTDGTGIPNDKSLTASSGAAGLHIKIIEDPSTDCKNNTNSCKFFYTPIFQFEISPYGNFPKTQIKHFETHSVVSLFLRLYTSETKQIALEKINYTFNRTFSTKNLAPLPITRVIVAPSYHILPIEYKKYGYKELYASFPRYSLDFNNKSLLSDTIKIDFIVPAVEAENIKTKFEQGVDMKIDFEYVKREFSENKKHASATIQVDHDLKREFTGGRSKVYASKSQILELAMRSVVELAEHSYIENSDILPIFETYSTMLMNSIVVSETVLEKIQGEVISAYKLDENDELLTPNLTTKTKKSSDRLKDEHNLMTKIRSGSKKIDGGLSGGALWGLFKGSANGGYNRTTNNTDSSDKHKINHIVKNHEWEGAQFDPLQIEMYEISSVALDKKITLDVNYVFAGSTGTTVLTAIRSTDSDLSR
ncbi:MAG: hypothetical protein IT215_06915 [Chitinophagaceae bacterium]|nr:hypothetical protein [Chitinophagaceae bacterium]